MGEGDVFGGAGSEQVVAGWGNSLGWKRELL